MLAVLYGACLHLHFHQRSRSLTWFDVLTSFTLVIEKIAMTWGLAVDLLHTRLACIKSYRKLTRFSILHVIQGSKAIPKVSPLSSFVLIMLQAYPSCKILMKSKPSAK